jgi:hypothetical protein
MDARPCIAIPVTRADTMARDELARPSNNGPA